MDDDENARVLVDRARSGDDNAARELIRQLYPLVAKIVRGYRPRRTAEEDLAQMIFIKVFQNLTQYSGKVPISLGFAHRCQYLPQSVDGGKSAAGIASRRSERRAGSHAGKSRRFG